MRDGRQPGVAPAPGRAARRGSEPLAEVGERARPGSSGGSADRSGRRRPPAPLAAAAPAAGGRAAWRGRVGRRRLRGSASAAVRPRPRRSTSATSKSTADSASTPAGVGEVVGDAFAEPALAAALAPERRGRSSASSLRRPDPAPAGLRPADAVGAGRPVDLAGRRDPVLVGRSELEGVEAVGGLVRAVARPGLDRVGGGVEQLVEPPPLVGCERAEDVVDACSDPVRRSRPAAG